MASELPKRRCSQTTTAGKPCRQYAMQGSDRCATHLKVAGQKSKLTPELHRKIVDLIRVGSRPEVACVASGISRSTFYDWLDRGDPAGAKPENALYRAFHVDVEQARAIGENALVAIVQTEARQQTWQAAVWLLERMYPERWARASQRELPGLAEKVAAAPFDAFAEADELAEARRKRLSGGR
jgi:hypothetical protein